MRPTSNTVVDWVTCTQLELLLSCSERSGQRNMTKSNNCQQLVIFSRIVSKSNKCRSRTIVIVKRFTHHTTVLCRTATQRIKTYNNNLSLWRWVLSRVWWSYESAGNTHTHKASSCENYNILDRGIKSCWPQQQIEFIHCKAQQSVTATWTSVLF